VDALARTPALPEPAPLAMPAQRLDRPAERRMRPDGRWAVTARRLFVIGGTLLLTGYAAWQMHRVLAVAGLTVPEAIVLGLFCALFAWIAFACLGVFGGLLRRLGRADGDLPLAGELPELAGRTAILLPIYNEETARVMAGLQATYESLAETGRLAHFDVFILSDTTDAEIWVAEEAAFLALRRRTGGHRRIFYRRRPKNVERKAGNIADWVRQFGAAYPHMLVLDADSTMSGEAIVRLAATMERNPGLGLVQTLPAVVGGRTLFARLQQFAHRLYGPPIAEGLAWWHGGESNFWGHNAIVRTAAFAAAAGLPKLPGPRPFGGHILSHDFVEAALLRRAGWQVRLVPGLAGSYEEGPPSLPDLAIRDRRWCQGNLQHMAVLPARGLHWVSRLHLLTGIGSYVTAPLWLALLGLGLLISLQARFVRPEYFPSEFSLFPEWPAQDPVLAAYVFAGTMGVLLAPKLVAFLLMLFDPPLRRGCGGGVRAFLGMLVETLLAGLLAPLAMLSQSAAVLTILAGRDGGWRPQRRDDGSIPMGGIVRRYLPHTLLGLGLGLAAWLVALPLLYWMSPVVLGLLLAIPLAALTATRGAGRAFARLGLLAIPEEREPPPVLRRRAALLAELAAEAAGPPAEAAARLAADPALLAAHLAMLPAEGVRRRGDFDPARLVGLAKLHDAETLAAALRELTPAEKAAVLGDRQGVERLLALAGGPLPTPAPRLAAAAASP